VKASEDGKAPVMSLLGALIQDLAGTGPDAPASAAGLSELPQLRFIAWQHEWRTNGVRALRLPDGGSVTDAASFNLMREREPTRMVVGEKPEPPFLYLWFTHPSFDRNSMVEMSFVSDDGGALPRGNSLGSSSGARELKLGPGRGTWLLATASPGSPIPAATKVRLRYVVGPLENSQEVSPTFRGGMSLAGNSLLNGIGQNTDGNAFVTLAVDAASNTGRRFSARAVTRDGRELESTGGGWTGNADGTGVRVENFEFAIPLSQIMKFRIGTRPIRTAEFTNVVLRVQGEPLIRADQR
jgi:hypothetical protein